MRAIITGITGQTGSYMAELLLKQNVEVIGLVRRCSHHNTERIEHILKNIRLVEYDLTDYNSVYKCIQEYSPYYIFNFAAQSHVHTSFSQPSYTFNVNAGGVLNILESVKSLKLDCRIIQASTSEMFGNSYTTHGEDKYQNESTPMNPQSPYAIAKLAAYNLMRLYRKSYNIFAANAIMFNNESSRRGEMFVTRKITKYIADLVKIGNINYYYGISGETRLDIDTVFINNIPKLKLGNLLPYRDWGFSGDTVEAVWKIINYTVPDDFVVCTGETHSVEEFVNEAFKVVGLNWKDHVEIDPDLFRPSEVPYLCGDNTKVRKLGWQPKTTFNELVRDMVINDLQKKM